MNKKILIGVVLMIAIALGIYGLMKFKHHGHSGSEPPPKEEGAVSHYTCPMHPHIHEDKPGDCPICHMKLVPVNQKSEAPGEIQGAKSSLTISPERQQLVGIQTVSAQRRRAFKEIRTTGRVAFDPNLAVAQKEYLEIINHAPSMKAAATERLRLLGMSTPEINDLSKNAGSSTDLYLPSASDSAWVYATVYQSELEWIKPNSDAAISLPSNSAQKFSGTIRSIDPVLDPMTRSARARIFVPRAGGDLIPDSFVDVYLKIEIGEVITLPKSAVIDTGPRQIAFVVAKPNQFESRAIVIGSEIGDEWVISEGIREGEKVVASSAFLVDSESQLKAAVSGMESPPSCSEGETWDGGMSMCMAKVSM